MRLVLIQAFFMLFLITHVSTGFASDAKSAECHLSEIDPKTKAIYASSESYEAEKLQWDLVSRPAVGIFDLAHAYAVFKFEQSRANLLKSDKAKHCYIGCAVGLATSPKVTDYLGWLKEDLDLRDCDVNTMFEPADMAATSKGTKLGARDKKECATLCRDQFTRRR